MAKKAARKTTKKTVSTRKVATRTAPVSTQTNYLPLLLVLLFVSVLLLYVIKSQSQNAFNPSPKATPTTEIKTPKPTATTTKVAPKPVIKK